MSERSSELGIAGASLSVLATGGSVYTFNIFVVCAERERVSPRSTARYSLVT